MIRTIAINLPQFHPFPENDEWWGKGFTEWTNVTKAKPQFKGHYQPHLPTDLGFYDLRLEEARVAQAEMAKAAGIYGFCYYHYWFNGKRLMQRPLDDMLKTQTPDFPFILCWANENWSRRWDGSDHLILIEQNYSESDAIKHCASLIPFFSDNRYIKVHGKPVFCFYKPELIPNINEYLEAFRKEAQKNGFELYLCFMDAVANFSGKGFDAAIEFQPFTNRLQQFKSAKFRNRDFLHKIKDSFDYRVLRFLAPKLFEKKIRLSDYIDYNHYVDFLIQNYKYPTDRVYFPSLTPMWDNTARRGASATVFINANPHKYKEWLNFHVQNFTPRTNDENFVFINAWNEWAEGNHLEPCIKWGTSYLDATKEVLIRS